MNSAATLPVEPAPSRGLVPVKAHPAGEHSGVEMAPTWVKIGEDVSRDELDALVRDLAEREQRGQEARWQLGDALGAMERRHGVTYRDVAATLGRTERTIYNWVSLAGGIPAEVRRADVAWRTHRAVQQLANPEDQRRWLARAAEENLSEEELRALIERDENSAASAERERGGSNLEDRAPDNCPTCGQSLPQGMPAHILEEVAS